jgi:hypothetical protein
MDSKASVEEAEHEPLCAPLQEEFDDNNISSFRLSETHSSKRYGARYFSIIAMIIIVILVVYCITLTLRLKELGMKLQDLQKNKCAFPTDVEDATRYIQYEQRVFTGAIAMNKTSNGIEFYQQLPEGEPRFFGDPAVHSEIDANWQNLLSSESKA